MLTNTSLASEGNSTKQKETAVELGLGVIKHQQAAEGQTGPAWSRRGRCQPTTVTDDKHQQVDMSTNTTVYSSTDVPILLMSQTTKETWQYLVAELANQNEC